jgi:hypothetical protein
LRPEECDDNPFFAGEVEPASMDRRRGRRGLGQDVQGIVDRLVAEQLPDGGWNCEAANGSMRSSFNTTICAEPAYTSCASGHRRQDRPPRVEPA